MLRVAIKTTITKKPAKHALFQLAAQRSYHENIVEHYENPRNVGSLDKNDDNVGTVSFQCSILFFDDGSWLASVRIVVDVCFLAQ